MKDFDSLVRSASVSDMVQARDLILKNFAEIEALVVSSREMCKGFGIWAPTIYSDIAGSRTGVEGSRVQYRQRIDAEFWRKVIDLTGVKTLMTSTQIRAFDRQLHGDDTPEFTLENIDSTLRGLLERRGTLLVDAVVELFGRLSSRFASNKESCFGSRIIFSNFAQSYPGRGRSDRYCWPHSEEVNVINDLNRIMHRLDGKLEPAQEEVFSIGMYSEGGEKRMPYFTVKWYMGGTAHVVFTSPELVRKMNEMIGEWHPDSIGGARRNQR